MVTFEMLNANLTMPPQISVNNNPLGGISLQLPDLADPAFQGTQKAFEKDMQFHYAGWIKCQKVIPGSYLQSGSNQLLIQLSEPKGSAAIRSVEVQLKYNWESFESTLLP